MARSVGDLDLFDAAITGRVQPLRPMALTGVRIATPPEYFEGLDPEVERVTGEALQLLEKAGAVLVKAPLPAELEGALSEAFAHPGPALVDVVSARQELVMPPSTSADQAYHFGLFMLRAVMDGRGQQLIDLAKVNLFR